MHLELQKCSKVVLEVYQDGASMLAGATLDRYYQPKTTNFSICVFIYLLQSLSSHLQRNW